jgi:hypothetical protein
VTNRVFVGMSRCGKSVTDGMLPFKWLKQRLLSVPSQVFPKLFVTKLFPHAGITSCLSLGMTRLTDSRAFDRIVRIVRGVVGLDRGLLCLDSVSAKGSGVSWEFRPSIHETRIRFSPDGKSRSSGCPPSPLSSVPTLLRGHGVSGTRSFGAVPRSPCVVRVL